MQLPAYQQVLPQFKEAGATLVMVSPQTVENTKATADKFHLEYTVLSDQGSKVANQYRLVYTLPENVRPIFEGMGIDIPGHNGDDSYTLPLPATFVIDRDSVIRWAMVSLDHAIRAEPEDIVQAVKDIVG